MPIGAIFKAMFSRCRCKRRREGREPIDPLRLKTGDIVLIRSKTTASGFTLDTGVASGIHHSIAGLSLPVTNKVDMFDRVGVLLVPTVSPTTPISCATVQVLEATFKGIRSRSLTDISRTVAFAVVRHLALPGREMGAREAKDEAIPETLEEKKLRECVQPLRNRPYTDSKIKAGPLKPVFDYTLTQLQQHDLSELHQAKIRALALKQEQDWGITGARGIRFDGLLDLLKDMADPKQDLPNSFSMTDIHRLVGKYNDRHNDVLKADEVTRVWEESFKHAMVTRKQPRSYLTGAFVSFVYQTMGLLAKEHFFPVMHWVTARDINMWGNKVVALGPAETAMMGKAELTTEFVVLTHVCLRNEKEAEVAAAAAELHNKTMNAFLHQMEEDELDELRSNTMTMNLNPVSDENKHHDSSFDFKVN